MSNIYILEPPTSGKVLLKTTVGDIDIELWTKEAPKACRNFIQLCMEGYYNGTIFHRVVKGFIVQGGDPSGDGTGGESSYGEPFKDEFHQRLKFVRRGLVAMANAGKDDNGSQFFFTLGSTPELQNKHTIFGKVTGDTLFNMLKLAEGLIVDECPTYPHKVNGVEILSNPFTDIVPRMKEVEVVEKVKKPKVAGVKNFKLLSFGAEAEEDEEETTVENKKFAGKSKSTHDVLDDPKLSSEAALVQSRKDGDDKDEEVDRELQLENIRKKLRTENKKPIAKIFHYDEDDYEEEEEQNERKKRKEDILKEIKDVKREYHKNKLQKEQQKAEENRETIERNEVTEEYLKECDQYKVTSDSFPKKGKSREEFTLNLLAKFKSKLESAKKKNPEEEEEDEPEPTNDGNEDEKWMTHKLRFQDGEPVLAKDANTKGDDWFEIYDPRNPLNKRRRGEATSTSAK